MDLSDNLVVDLSDNLVMRRARNLFRGGRANGDGGVSKTSLNYSLYWHIIGTQNVE